MKQLFQDVDGQYSSKRFMTFIAFLAFIETIQLNLFMGVKLDGDLQALLFTLVLAGMGMITSEKFTSRGKKDGN